MHVHMYIYYVYIYVCVCVCVHVLYVTRPEKTGLIYAKYTHLYYGGYLFLCSCYLISVNFIEFLRILCTHVEICVVVLCCQVAF